MDVVGKQAWTELPQGHLPGGQRKAKERSREDGKDTALGFSAEGNLYHCEIFNLQNYMLSFMTESHHSSCPF